MTGAAATEADIKNETENKLRPEINKLENLENELINKQDLLKTNEHQKIVAESKIQEIDTKLNLPNSQFTQNSLLLQRKILQSFKTSTLQNLEMLEKGNNHGFK